MAQHHLKTAAITAMFISVLFLTGCGRKENTPTTTTPATTQESTTAPQNNTQSPAPEQTQASATTPTTTPPATTTTNDATTTLASSFQSYKTPAGDEEVKVTATVDAKGIVQSVQLAYVTHAPKSKIYQDLFSEGISAQVVGKELKNVSVGVVNGSSLTAEGFNKAIDQLEKQFYATN